MTRLAAILVLCALVVFLAPGEVTAASYIETPKLEAQVTSGTLPPVAARLPETPRVIDMAAFYSALVQALKDAL